MLSYILIFFNISLTALLKHVLYIPVYFSYVSELTPPLHNYKHPVTPQTFAADILSPTLDNSNSSESSREDVHDHFDTSIHVSCTPGCYSHL